MNIHIVKKLILIISLSDIFSGMIVLTDYNNKFYRVDDVDFSRNPSKTFEIKKTNTQESYIDYYKRVSIKFNR